MSALDDPEVDAEETKEPLPKRPRRASESAIIKQPNGLLRYILSFAGDPSDLANLQNTNSKMTEKLRKPNAIRKRNLPLTPSDVPSTFKTVSGVTDIYVTLNGWWDAEDVCEMTIRLASDCPFSNLHIHAVTSLFDHIHPDVQSKVVGLNGCTQFDPADDARSGKDVEWGNFTALKSICNVSMTASDLGRVPASVQSLEVATRSTIPSTTFARFTCLKKLAIDTDEWMTPQAVAGMTSLRSLQFFPVLYCAQSNSPQTDATLALLPKLEELAVCNSDTLTGSCFSSMFMLTWLVIDACPQVTDAALEGLATHDRLKKLELSGCPKITGSWMDSFPDMVLGEEGLTVAKSFTRRQHA